MNSGDAIYLISQDGGLERIPQSGYAAEAVLQGLIADYPDLLSGEQIDPENPPRWLLVKREAGVPDADGGADRWSVDHLLIDQFAVPTIVEVKRASDTRIRREVLGQMLEYAANATRYWPPDRVRALAAEGYGGMDGLDARVLDLLSHEGDEDRLDAIQQYWKDVDANLAAGRVRLLFVADELPRELRRLIEFLNEKMRDVEVLGVELRQYTGASLKALVPRVVGRLEKEGAKGGSRTPGTKTNKQEFLNACPDWSRGLFEEILDHAATEEFEVGWGTKGFSIRVNRPSGEKVSLFYGYPAGAVGHERPFIEIYLKQFGEEQSGRDLRASVAAVPSFTAQGQYTLRSRLTEENVADVRVILPKVWDTCRRLRIDKQVTEA
jgi:hypothetical protein